MFFSNGADTRTYGLDFTSDYHTDLGGSGAIDWDLSVNFNHTDITRIGLDGNGKPLLDPSQVADLTTNSPRSKVILGGTWSSGVWLASVHEIRYGTSVSLDQFYTGPEAFSITDFYRSINGPKYVTNVEFGLHLNGFEWVLGADNLFDEYPKLLPPANRYIGAALYDAYTGLGINGGYYYTRLSYHF